MATVMRRRGLGRRRSRLDAGADLAAAPVFWGHIGSYEAVSRRGVLLLLDPEPVHPSLRVRNGGTGREAGRPALRRRAS